MLSESGGAARDIREYCVHGRLPVNELDPSAKGYAARQQAVAAAVTTLPKICDASKDPRTGGALLFFFDGGDPFDSVQVTALISRLPTLSHLVTLADG